MLLIDGAYLFVGSKELQKQTNRRLMLNDRTVPALLQFRQHHTQNVFSQRHYVTAEHDKASIQSRHSLYAALKKNGVSVDIRGFKKKQVNCP